MKNLILSAITAVTLLVAAARGRSQMLGDRSSCRVPAVCVVVRRYVDGTDLLSRVRLHADLPHLANSFLLSISATRCSLDRYRS